MFRERLPEKVTFKQRLEEEEGEDRVRTGGKNIPARRREWGAEVREVAGNQIPAMLMS